LGSQHYPFDLDLNLKDLQFTEIDLVSAKAVGNVHIEGNAFSGIAKGEIEIQDAEVTIPDHIPRPLPDLAVTYRNPTHPTLPLKKNYRPYPLHLDLNVLPPTQISIEGRGLTSLWKGHFHLGGTTLELATKGLLELIEGEFNFSSRSFKLIEGSLAFSGVEHQMPYLNLAGQMETKGITITARLKGPLDDPQITLVSNPPLPLGSIMSYLLFGQDISEIGGFQALQIATSLASLAGTGPDVMETTRRSLGVDRLRVVTEPTEEGGETVALQVSKYISKGVLVSFTQGTDESSTNISVEIELKNNFVFQIESDQRQEQGKFTLKWNHNY
jgi:translocation and assembly module TamB